MVKKAKTKKKFIMQLARGDRQLFDKGMKRTNSVSRAELVRMGLRTLAKGGK